jgi:hypothetical protein
VGVWTGSLYHPQGKQILFVDMTNCVSEEAMLIASEVQRVVTTQPRNSVLTLSDLTSGEFRRDAITRMKEVAVFDRPYVRRAAIVGAESLSNVFYEALKTLLPTGKATTTTTLTPPRTIRRAWDNR